MEVILTRDVKDLGKEGDTVKVKDGYARNYLIPGKMAVLKSAGALKNLESKKKRAALEEEKRIKDTEALAKRIAQLSLTIPAESGEDDTLFGSVTAEMIASALGEEGVQIDRKSVIIKEPIRKLGIYDVEIKLHPEVKITLKVWVVKAKAK